MSSSNNTSSGFNGAYGARLLPHIIDDLAREQPDAVWCVVPKSPKSYQDGAVNVTYPQMARAVDRFAWWLEENVGRPSEPETLAFMGLNDIRYAVFIFGAIKAGYTMLYSSPRNSVSNHLNLIEKTHCKTFLKDRSVHLDHIVAAHHDHLHVLDVPDLSYFFAEGEVQPYSWNATYDEVKDQKALILHSSGSTGQVKPIPLTNAGFASLDRQHMLREDAGLAPLFTALTSEPGSTAFVPMPLFHGAAILMGVLCNTFYQLPFVLAPPDVPLNVSTVVDALENVKPTYLMLAPSILEEMTEDPNALKALGIPRLVMYGGGPLSDYASDVIAKHTNLQPYIGSTEAGAYPIYEAENHKEDYLYLRFDPQADDIEFRHQDGDIYKMYLTRGSGKQPVWSSIFDVFPDKKEYDTSDLYRAHPTKPGYWKHAGRDDDVIVLSNGEKVVPSSTEYTLHECPQLHEVILYGAKRFQVAAIVELEDSALSLSRAEALEKLAPYLKKANANAPAHAQLVPERILFTTADKQLIRTPKGTVARNASYKSFEMELDALYEDSDDSDVASSSNLVKDVDEQGTVKALQDLFKRAVDLPNFPPEQNFLTSGVDSLKIISIVRNIRKQLKSEGAEVSQNSVNNTLVYNNPTIKSLAHALHSIGAKVNEQLLAEQRIKDMEDVYQKYSAYLPKNRTGRAPVFTDNMTVVLTGSTGSLGSYLLAGLLANPGVSKVYALNRSKDGRAAQEAAFRARELEPNFGHRVAFYHMDVGKPLLGLEQSVYDSIVAKVDVILHNAWPVNFNVPLSYFEPHVAGMRTLIDLAIEAPSRPALLFTSSVGTASVWPALHPDEPVPEHLVTDPHVAGGNAYGGSKWIADRMLVEAARNSGVRSVIVRVGQMAGSVSTVSNWNKWEWFPSIIQSSAYLGLVPDSTGKMTGVDFVPLDSSANILLELAFGAVATPDDDRTLVYNMVNPTHVPYNDFAPLIRDRLAKSTGKDIKIVSWPEWVRALQQSAKYIQDADIERNPGVKLADFYAGLAAEDGSTIQDTLGNTFAVEETKKRSKTMRELEAVKEDWVLAWIKGLGL